MSDTKTIKAIKGSIAKWQAIVDDTGEDEGSRNCPLCKVFLDDDCCGCPVKEHTGMDCCSDTPYELWDDYMDDNDMLDRIVFDPESRRIAKAELDFLKEVLKEHEANDKE